MHECTRDKVEVVVRVGELHTNDESYNSLAGAVWFENFVRGLSSPMRVSVKSWDGGGTSMHLKDRVRRRSG